MSATELRRVHILRQVREKRITQRAAGTLLGLTDRQIRRLLRRIEQEGDQGLVHRGRGKPSNRWIPETKKTKVLTLYDTQYGDLDGEKGVGNSLRTVREKWGYRDYCGCLVAEVLSLLTWRNAVKRRAVLEGVNAS